MTPEQRDKAVVAIAPIVAAMANEPFTEKGLADLGRRGISALSAREIKQLRVAVSLVASIINVAERPNG